jgi:TLC domain
VLQPCVYIRWVLYKLKKTDSMGYVVNGIAMLLAFFLTRNVFGLGAQQLMYGCILLILQIVDQHS